MPLNINEGSEIKKKEYTEQNTPPKQLEHKGIYFFDKLLEKGRLSQQDSKGLENDIWLKKIAYACNLLFKNANAAIQDIYNKITDILNNIKNIGDRIDGLEEDILWELDNNSDLMPKDTGSGSGVQPPPATGNYQQYWRGDDNWADFPPAARNVPLTGLSTFSNANITPTDTILTALGKTQGKFNSLKSVATSGDYNDLVNKPDIPDISGLFGGMSYQGTWNAATNNPNLTTVKPKGQYWRVTTAGTFGGKSYDIGDWIVSNGLSWDKVDNTDLQINNTLNSTSITQALSAAQGKELNDKIISLENRLNEIQVLFELNSEGEITPK